jgi:hypothetical protein
MVIYPRLCTTQNSLVTISGSVKHFLAKIYARKIEKFFIKAFAGAKHLTKIAKDEFSIF